jgi:Na+/H+ antiporter NhaD/arsenite permease-like protein
MAVAIGIFALTLGAIASERVDRTKAALVGAVLVLLTQTIPQDAAIEAVDWNTLGLLAGMMLMVRLTEATGVYAWLAIRAAQLSRGRPATVVASLALTTAVLSAFLDNLTTILLVVPITFVLAEALEIKPLPLILIEILVSNIGGTATLIGDPPNILIAGATRLTFLDFVRHLAPVAATTLVLATAGLYLAFRRELRITPEARARVLELDASTYIRDRSELRRTMPILGATILLFFAHQPLHLEPATVALAGATATLLVTRQSLHRALADIEWPTLFFFIGLFVLVGSLEHTGAIDHVARAIGDVTGGNRTAELLGILWTSAVGSALVDNIPFTAAMLPVVEQLQPDGGGDGYWWSLALGACFGGNATLIAAAANVAAAGLAGRAGHPIGFVAFLRVGVPITLGSLAIATGYVAVRYM